MPLPIYHRQYDTRILLLAFPAVAYLLAAGGRRVWGLLGLLLMTVATVVTAHPFLNRLIRAPGPVEHAGPFRTLLLYRPMPEMLLLLFLFFTVSLWRLRDGGSAGRSPTALRTP